MESDFFGKSVAEVALEAVKKLDEEWECDPVTQRAVWKGEGFGRHCEMPAAMLEDKRGAAFVATLAEGFKIAWDNYFKEHPEIMAAQTDGPWLRRLRQMAGPWIRGEWVDDKTFVVEPFHKEDLGPNPYLEALGVMAGRVRPRVTDFYTPMPVELPDVCECGSGNNVRGPGHSDWCNLKERDG
jgi:hypothetical protein